MQSSPTPQLIALVILLLLGGGCSSMGVKKRISEKSAVFESLTSQQQKNIRAGFIEKGFTKDMVYIALGKPSKITSKDSPLGKLNTWIYRNYYSPTDLLSIQPSKTTGVAQLSSSVPNSGAPGLGSTHHNRQSRLSVDDAPLDTLYVVFIDGEVFGISLESQGGPIEL